MELFGKTLNLSMIRYFFEKTAHDTGYLFKGLKIEKEPNFMALQGQFPVIFLSLKAVRHSSWEQAYASIRSLVAGEYNRHRYLLEGDTLHVEEKKKYLQILREEGSQTLYTYSLLLLTQCLHRYHKKRVIVLVDDYDTPAYAAYVGGYYDVWISFFINWLSAGLKDNSSLERGVLTGAVSIPMANIFSGFNNLSTYTVLQDAFCDKFGLLEEEVKELVKEHHLEANLLQMRQWYDGYRIGSCRGIYNPWSVIKYLREEGDLAPYWVNSCDNALMRGLIAQGSEDFKADIEELLKGGVIEKNIEEGLIFADLAKGPNAVWSLLLFSGYLTTEAGPTAPGSPSRLRIPNEEVLHLYRSMVIDWFEKSIHESKYCLLLQSLTKGDIDTFSKIFQEFLLASVSVFDVASDQPEKIYHAFILGMLVGLGESYEVRSNRESGYGRYDVMLIPKDVKGLGIVLEFKRIDRFEKMDLETAAASALKQIQDKKYDEELVSRGITRILHLSLVFEGEKVLIRAKQA